MNEIEFIDTYKPWYEKYVYPRFPECRKCKIWTGSLVSSLRFRAMHMWHISPQLAQQMYDGVNASN